MGGIFELDVNVGVKHPGPNGTSIRYTDGSFNFNDVPDEVQDMGGAFVDAARVLLARLGATPIQLTK